MTSKTLKRWLIVLAILAAVLAAAAAIGMHFAAKILKDQVQQALGPESEVGEISVGWSAIEIRKLRVRGPKGWPAEHTLRAERIVIVPDLLGLVSAKIRIDHIKVEQAYLSVLRARDKKVRLLPSMLEKPAAKSAADASSTTVAIGSIVLTDGVLEFFDATVRQPAHKVRLEHLEAKVDDLLVPSLAGRTQLKLEGTIKGVQRNGKMSLNGWAEIADKNSELATKLHGVDLVALQPYLIKAAETGVKRGSMDLNMKSTVHNNRLHAPGTLTLSDLELSSAGGAGSTFMGVPRQAVVGSLKDRNGKIVIQFALDGNLNDPQFSINDSFSKKIGASVAESLGISIEGLTRGVGGATEGLGGAMKRLFGK
jgi:hypothetical protein